MTIEFRDAEAPDRPPLHRYGVRVVIASVVLMLLGLVVLAVGIGPAVVGTLSATPYTLPMDTAVTLSPGRWVIFEQTGGSSQTGPVTVTTSRAPRIRAAQVTVTDGAGGRVAASDLSSRQTLTVNGVIYTGAVSFAVSSDGPYRVVVPTQQGQVIVGRDLGDLFGSWAVGFALSLLPPVGIVVGIVMILLARRRSAPAVVRAASPYRSPAPTPAAAVSPTAPPGWYPDPRGPGAYLWWDGSHWRVPRAPGSPPDGDPHPIGPRL